MKLVLGLVDDDAVHDDGEHGVAAGEGEAVLVDECPGDVRAKALEVELHDFVEERAAEGCGRDEHGVVLEVAPPEQALRRGLQQGASDEGRADPGEAAHDVG